MGKSRGFFAELQHQQQLAEKRRLREESAAQRAQLAAARQFEQAKKQAARAREQAARASAAEQKAAEREAKRLHEEERQAEVTSLNANLANTCSQIDSMLAATLTVDDYVDLEKLRKVTEHPPFPKPDLLQPTPAPVPLMARPEPQYVEPAAPRGLAAIFGGKKKHAAAIAAAHADYSADHSAWQAEVAQLPAAQLRQQQEHQQTEEKRLAKLKNAQAKYEGECRERETATQKENGKLDTLIQGLAYGVEEAIQEYVSIVLGNSAYPDSFTVEHDFTFDSSLRELALTVLVPAPQTVPTVKEYRYAKAKDEITSTSLTAKDQKDRYLNAVTQVALRSLHEIFEADRAGRIATITLTVASEAINAATGILQRTPLVAVATDRATFTGFDLGNVVPLATLKHLGALVSANPYDLVAIDTSKGVRGK